MRIDKELFRIFDSDPTLATKIVVGRRMRFPLSLSNAPVPTNINRLPQTPQNVGAGIDASKPLTTTREASLPVTPNEPAISRLKNS